MRSGYDVYPNVLTGMFQSFGPVHALLLPKVNKRYYTRFKMTSLDVSPQAGRSLADCVLVFSQHPREIDPFDVYRSHCTLDKLGKSIPCAGRSNSV